jgi:hypothetical protein
MDPLSIIASSAAIFDALKAAYVRPQASFQNFEPFLLHLMYS